MSRYWNKEADNGRGDLVWLPIIRDTLLVAVIFIAAIMYGCPQYHVWEQGLVGQAELRRAEQNRQIKVQEAEAIKDSSKLLAEAEVERAKGNAKANEIISGGLGGPEGYLRYLWIHLIAENKSKNQIIYIPTEAGMPILEAGKRHEPAP